MLHDTGSDAFTLYDRDLALCKPGAILPEVPRFKMNVRSSSYKKLANILHRIFVFLVRGLLHRNTNWLELLRKRKVVSSLVVVRDCNTIA